MSTSHSYEGKGRYGSPIADDRVGVRVKLWNPLRTRAIPDSASAVVIHYEEAL